MRVARKLKSFFGKLQPFIGPALGLLQAFLYFGDGCFELIAFFYKSGIVNKLAVAHFGQGI
ncbi:MAG TPA: hypothetical protein VMR46_03845 [Candidatus Paceibacterota bacterium]|nr:hypothetical protein [Candidatus Paceibacterota bacterium]